MSSKCYQWIKTVGALLLAAACMSASSYSKVLAAAADESLQEQLAEAQEKGTVYVIAQDGSGDFTTIQEGVDNAASGDTLLIYPGVYEENVEIYNKTVNLLGTDKDSCVLKYQSTEYHKIPLTFGAGCVANLTIYGFNEGERENNRMVLAGSYDNSSLESIWEWQKNFSGYALHIDQNYTYGKEAYIENCRIISNNNQCIGIGCRGESTITFENCELISNGSGGCIYLHNTDDEKLGGETHFIMKNSELKNYLSPYVISMHSAGEGNPVYLTFQNVRTSTVVYENMNAYRETNMNSSFSIDELIVLEQGNLLRRTGYDSSTAQEYITHYDQKESCKYISSLEAGITPLRDTIEMPEGILYLHTKDSKKEDTEKVTQTRFTKRYVIDIFNSSQINGDGWCGLDHIYLTPDSYANSLAEMNYPLSDE
ncbi:MAG: hypothetical protein J6D08_03015 [Lachnospiraceae bacterium]|nr:hypothetical protein [Lachnospiraceae bacterium]